LVAFLQAETSEVAAQSRLTSAQQKARRGIPPGRLWHSFGEYIFLEDSRYMSQAE